MTRTAPPPLLSLVSARSGGFTLLAVLLMFVMAADVPVLAQGNSGNAPGQNKDKDDGDGGGGDDGGGGEALYQIVPVGSEFLSPAINDLGELVAYGNDSQGHSYAVYRPQITDADSEILLPATEGTSEPRARGLNMSGLAVGDVRAWNDELNSYQRFPVVWDLWSQPNGNTAVTALPVPDGVTTSSAFAINNSGHALGAVSYAGEWSQPVLWILESGQEGGMEYASPLHLVLWTPEDASSAVVRCMTDSSENGSFLLGGNVRLPRSDDDTAYYSVPCLWKVQSQEGDVEITWIPLPHEPNIDHHVLTCNAIGDVLGRRSDSDDLGLVWKNEGDEHSEPIDIGNLALTTSTHGSDQVFPHDMNILGDVVGFNRYLVPQGATTWETTVFIWQDGSMRDLNKLLPDGYEFDGNADHLQRPAINAWGQILGLMNDGMWYLAIPASEDPGDDNGDNGDNGDDPGDPGATPMTVLGVDFVRTRNGRHLDVTVWVVDEDGGVPGAEVALDVFHNDNLYDKTDGSTDNDGAFRFRLSNAPSGDYSVTITSVTKDGWKWDEAEETFHK